jgi:hypothetical protein
LVPPADESLIPDDVRAPRDQAAAAIRRGGG